MTNRMHAAMSGSGEETGVFIIDDDKSLRIALEDLLDSVGLKAYSYGSVTDFLQSDHPDIAACLVLDIRMPGMSGLDFHRDMERLKIDIPVVFITGHGDIPMSVRAMKQGAIEFLTKPFREQDLLDAIYHGIELSRYKRIAAQQLAELRTRYASLTKGEAEVVGYVAQGFLNKQIAGELNVSEITVKVRRAQAMKKMAAASLAELLYMLTALK